MKRGSLLNALFATALLCNPAVAASQSTPGPEITAQGFDIAQPQVGTLGNFGRLRLRIEAPDRNAELGTTERSCEADLANTLEIAHLGASDCSDAPASTQTSR